MKIERLEIKGFGALSRRMVQLKPGINLLYGANESGKSTLQWFIQGMLYGLKGGRGSKEGLPPPARRFKPWSGDAFSGVLEYTLDDGRSFRIERDFSANTVEIYDAGFQRITDTFERSKERGPLIAEKHLGLTEACFEKTVLIRQMETRLDGEGGAELLSRLTNVAQTGFEDISFQKADRALREALRNYVGTDRSYTRPIDRVSARIRELEAAAAEAAESRRMQAGTESRLQRAREQKALLERKAAFLERTEHLIGVRRQAEEVASKEAALQEMLSVMTDLEARVQAASSGMGAAPSYGGGVSRRGQMHRRQAAAARRRRRVLFAAAVGLLLAAAGMAAFALMNPSTHFTAAGVLALGGVLLFALYALSGRRSGSAWDMPAGSPASPDTVQEILVWNERLKEACGKASALCGVQIGGSRDAEETLETLSDELGKLDARMKQGVQAVTAEFNEVSTEVFHADKLRGTLLSMDMKNLQTACARELTKLRDELAETALEIKECETLLSSGDREEEGTGADRLQMIMEELEVLRSEKASLEDTGEALKLAADVLTEAGTEIRRTFAPALNEGISDVMARMTGLRYRDVRADEALSIKAIAPETGMVTPVGWLSGGAHDQMYLGLRLTMADLISAGGETLPWILDEIFAQYDDDRTRQTLKYLYERSNSRQILLFTCKKRELELAVEVCGGNFHRVEL